MQCFVAFVFYLIGLYQNWSENKVVDVKAFDEEELNQTSNQSDWIRSYYEKKVPERMKFLRNMNSYTMSTFYTVVGPEVFCANLVRVGLVADGGKYICNIDRIPKGNCSIYSLGINGDISFDVDVQNFSNKTCRIYGYDKNDQLFIMPQYERINGKIEILKIAKSTNPSLGEYSLGDLLKRNNDSTAEILKIDVEGAEYEALIPFLQRHRVCQLLIEIHWPKHKHLQLVQQIASLNYALFSLEPNPFCDDINPCCEYSFIHLDCVHKYGAAILKLYLKDLKPPLW